MNGFAIVLRVMICFVILTDLMKVLLSSMWLKFSSFGWDHDGWRNKEWEEPKLGDAPWHPKLLSKEKQATMLGHPLFLLTTIGIILGAIFLFVTYHEFCLECLVLYESLLDLIFSLSQSSLLDTPFEKAIMMLWFFRIALCASLNFFELWNCSSASLISFWARCALIFLKKCSHASLRFIWELVKFWRNSLMLHLNYFERRKSLCSCSSLKFVWAYQMQHMKLVPKS